MEEDHILGPDRITFTPIFSQEEVDKAKQGINVPKAVITEDSIILGGGLPRPRAKKPSHRITVLENIYHQIAGQNPTSQRVAYERELTTDEQLFVRTTKTDIDWKPLETGWIQDCCSMLHIRNEEKIVPSMPAGVKPLPTMEIFLGIRVGEAIISVIRIKPTESIRFDPIGLRAWFIKGPDRSKYTLSVYPI